MRVKFLTLNIFNGEFLDKCIDFLKKENPDIFVLQEVYDSKDKSLEKKNRSLNILKKKFQEYYSFFTPEFYKKINGTKVDSGNVIFSRFPILRRESVYYSKSYGERKISSPEEFVNTARNFQAAEVKINNHSLNIVNTHGIWGFDGKDNKERLRMSDIICSKAKELTNVILAGDFNIAPNTVTIKNIEKILNNVFKDELKSTFNMKIKTPFVNKSSFLGDNDIKGYSQAVVDMVFV